MKNQKHMSEALGFSQNYLSQYKHSRSIDAAVDVDTLIVMYKAERIEHQRIIDAFHEMYYTLRSQRKIKHFAQYLVDKDVLPRFENIHSVISHSFSASYRLKSRTYLQKLLTILSHYEEWK